MADDFASDGDAMMVLFDTGRFRTLSVELIVDRELLRRVGRLDAGIAS